jgi:TRAP transporter TAXI family solute receptor
MYARMFCAFCVLLLLANSPLQSQTAADPKVLAQNRGVAPTAATEGEQDRAARVNSWTVGVASGLLEGTFIRFGADLARALDDGDKLRVLPIVTYGAGENISDLLYLKGVDIAITDADVFEEYKKSHAFSNIDRRINYISEMYISEFHLLVRPEIKTLQDLAGKKVGFNTKGSAANITGKIVFERMGVKVEPIFTHNSAAIEQMRTGELAGLVHTVGKPNDLFKKESAESGFHFLPLEYDAKFADYYVPTTLTAEDYPSLVKGEPVSTIGVPVVLAVYNWQPNSDRFRRVERFIQYYFQRFETMRKPPYHPKWREINLAAKVPGWTRYWVAEDMLNKTASVQDRAVGTTSNTSSTTPAPEPDPMYQEFLEWRKKQRR